MNLCIIQARMGSTRLPGKVLMEVGGKPIIRQVAERLTKAKSIDHLIVATTTNPEDDSLASFCDSIGIQVYRGSDWDVLDRFYQAATSFQLQDDDAVIRICCDNPIHSHKAVDFVMSQFVRLGVDYCSNSNQEPSYLEDGFDVEIVKFKALREAWKDAKMLSEREHVMPYVKNSGRYSLAWRKMNSDYRFKLSVDTPADLEVARTIFTELSDQPDFAIDEVVDLLKRKPEILELNKDSQINSGYAKSLREDRSIDQKN